MVGLEVQGRFDSRPQAPGIREAFCQPKDIGSLLPKEAASPPHSPGLLQPGDLPVSRRMTPTQPFNPRSTALLSRHAQPSSLTWPVAALQYVSQLPLALSVAP